VCKPAEDHGQRIRQGLRRAVQQGAVLGGLRPATERNNTAAHEEALRQAMDYRDVLEAGCDKSLSALSRDLFEAGCCTGSGKPLTPEMVRRLRNRLDEARRAIEAGDLEDEGADQAECVGTNNNPLPPDLGAFLLLHVCVSARDEDLTREVLRDVAENLSPGQAHKVASMLVDSISDSGRLWLSRLA
jgi:hypothetical protein